MPVAVLYARAPTNGTATGVSSTTISITFTKTNGPNYDYEVQRKAAGAPDSSFSLLTTIDSADPLPYLDTGNTPETSYSYRVRGVHPATGKKGQWSATFTGATLSVSGSESAVLISPAVLAAAQAKASGNTAQWQDFKARLDAELVVVTTSSYQADELPWIANFAAGYLALLPTDATTAKKYADKAIALIKSGLRDSQRTSYSTRQYLARGDGNQVTFNLPFTDNINASTFKVYTVTRSIATVTNHVTNSSSETVGYGGHFLKVSNTSDGTADYTERTITSRNPLTWSAGDWRQNTQLLDNIIDWSGASSQPGSGNTYYVTWADISSASVMSASLYTLNTGTGQVTFNSAPGVNTVVFVEYQYGTFTSGASTLGYQQTGTGRRGFNNILIDDGYTTRWLKSVPQGYDWLYDYAGFSSDLKGECEIVIEEWYNQARDSSAAKDSPANNYGAGHGSYRALAAVALDRHGHASGPTMLSEMATWRTNNTVPQCFDAPAAGRESMAGGGWAEGWSYGPLAVFHTLVPGYALDIHGVLTATKERDWAGDMIKALLHSQPSNANTTGVDGLTHQGTIVGIGDGSWYPRVAPEKYLWYLLAFLSSDSNAAAYANQFIQAAAQPQAKDWSDLLWRDPSASAVDWASALPLHYRATGLEYIFARAAWDYASTWLFFQCGNAYINRGNYEIDHQSYAQGHLVIQRGADNLLVDANNVSNQTGVVLSNGGKSSFANLVCLSDGGAGVQNYLFCQGSGAWYGTPGCQVLGYDAVSAYVYVYGDCKAAWSKNSDVGGGGSASLLHRCLFFVRPDLVVVYDRITMKSSAYVARLQWHFIADPTVTGDSWSLTQGSSKLFGTTVSGVSLTTTDDGTQTIEGHTSWTYSSTVSVYRVSTVVASPATSQRFCTVLQTAASGGSAYAVTRIVSGSDWEGVIVNGVTVVLFGQTAGPISTAGGKSYSCTQTGTATHYVADLTPSQQYTLSGDASGTPTASAAGVLTFSVTGSGAKTVTIT